MWVVIRYYYQMFIIAVTKPPSWICSTVFLAPARSRIAGPKKSRKFCVSRFTTFRDMEFSLPSFMPKWGFWRFEFDPTNVVRYSWDPQQAHSWPETRILAYRSSRSVKKSDLGAMQIKQKWKKRNRDVTSHIFVQTTHVMLYPNKVVMWVGSHAN